jgi:hypothetical protein
MALESQERPSVELPVDQRRWSRLVHFLPEMGRTLAVPGLVVVSFRSYGILRRDGGDRQPSILPPLETPGSAGRTQVAYGHPRIGCGVGSQADQGTHTA